MKAKEEIKEIEARLGKRQEKIRKAQVDLQKRKAAAEKEIEEVITGLPQKLTQAFLGDKQAVREVGVLKRKREEAQLFLADVPLIEEQLKIELSMIPVEDRHRLRILQTRISTLNRLLEEYKESAWSRSDSKKEELLKAAEEAGEREQIEKELEKLDSK